MAFMTIHTMKDLWYSVETRNGTDFIPASVCGDLDIPKGEEYDSDSPKWEELCAAVRDYCEGKPEAIECIGEQWAARYSAAGYLDCTDWVLADSEEEAVAECEAMYGDDEEDEEEEESEEDAEPTEPQEGDATLAYNGCLACEGEVIGTYTEYEEAVTALRQWAEANSYFPDLWVDNGGGNWVRHSY